MKSISSENDSMYYFFPVCVIVSNKSEDGSERQKSRVAQNVLKHILVLEFLKSKNAVSAFRLHL